MKPMASIYAKKQGDITKVRVLIRDGSSGEWTSDPIKRTFQIRQALVTHNKKIVFAAQIGPWTPADPSFEFHLAAGKPGDSIRLSWQDSKGTTHEVDSTIL